MPVADVPIGSLGDGPLYHRPLAPPEDLEARQAADPGAGAAGPLPLWPGPVRRAAATCSPPRTSRTRAGCGASTTTSCSSTRWPAPVATRASFGSRRRAASALAVSVDGKGRFCALDPRVGVQLAVLEAARERRVQWGPADGARQLPELREPRASGGDVAVLGDHRRHGRCVPCARHAGGRWQRQLLQRVPRRRHRPHPGGRCHRADRRARLRPPPGIGLRDGDRIVMLGETRPELGGSEWATPPRPACRLARRPRISRPAGSCTSSSPVWSRIGWSRGLHDCSDGGVAVALAEMAIAGGSASG